MVVTIDSSLNTLLHLKYHSTWRAGRGRHGRGKKQRGGAGSDVSIPVPVGTLVWRVDEAGERALLVDIVSPEPFVVCRGGAGGSGNLRFVTPVNREPLLAQKGADGDEATLLLELKLLADVGLVGKPNAGKSTLLSICSAARPKIADYPFTTTDPVLGVVPFGDNSFVMMEVPGLLEGAHAGVGLGHQFLRHAERCRLIVHLLDGLSEDPVGDWRQTNGELVSFEQGLAEKPQLVVINKLDVTEVRDRVPALRRALSKEGQQVQCISAATGEGVDGLVNSIAEQLAKLPQGPLALDEGTPVGHVRKARERIMVSKENGGFVVRAPRVERMVAVIDLKDHRAMVQLWGELEKIGVVKELEAMGVQPGDSVRLGGVELEWF